MILLVLPEDDRDPNESRLEGKDPDCGISIVKRFVDLRLTGSNEVDKRRRGMGATGGIFDCDVVSKDEGDERPEVVRRGRGKFKGIVELIPLLC